MLRVGNDKITLEGLVNGVCSTDSRTFIAGMAVTSVEYKDWEDTGSRTKEARSIQVTLVDPTTLTELTVSGPIDKVIEHLNKINDIEG